MKSFPWRLVFALALVGSLSFEIMGEKAPIQQVWDYPLFFALTGALGCLLLTVLAKGVVSPSIDRKEDFYTGVDAEGDWSRESPAAAEEAGRPFPPEDGSGSAPARSPAGGTQNPGEG